MTNEIERRLTAIETSLEKLERFLIGNGQPGVVEKHDMRITRIEWAVLILTIAVIGKDGLHLLGLIR